jgi:hypothetical protein
VSFYVSTANSCLCYYFFSISDWDWLAARMEQTRICSWNIKTHYLRFKHFIITITDDPLCGIESLYNGLSKTTKFLDIWSKINKIRVFENDEHFGKKKGHQPFGPGRAGQFRTQSPFTVFCYIQILITFLF